MLLILTVLFNYGIAKDRKKQYFQRINSMNKRRPVILQMQSLISRFEFEKLVKVYKTDKNIRTFSTWNLLQVMLFAHCAAKKSLRDICTSLSCVSNRFYHLGIGSISRNNLSNALAKRNAELFEKLFYVLLEKVHKDALYKADKRFRFKNSIIAIDSTVISLCLSLYDWADFRSTKGGIKIHTMFDLKKQLPDFMIISEARRHDHTLVVDMPFRTGAIYVLDRGYLCLETLKNIDKNGAFFVTRTKINTQYKIIKKSTPASKSILIDASIKFTGIKSDDYPDMLRLIRYKNPEDGKVYEYITNNKDLSAVTIADIYKSRWDIELFFKWMKQNMKMKSFIGTSRNAVLIQVWTAAIAFLLIAYIRFLSKVSISLTEIFRIVGSNLFSDKMIHELLSGRSRLRQYHVKQLDVQLDLGF